MSACQRRRKTAMRISVSLALCAVALVGTPALIDRDAGREVFRQHCIGCHAIECNRSGPKLGDLLDREAGTVPDFDNYSDAMKDAEIIWNQENLNAYLSDPETFIPNNAMAGFGKVEDDSERQSLIEFLSQPDSSLDLCF